MIIELVLVALLILFIWAAYKEMCLLYLMFIVWLSVALIGLILRNHFGFVPECFQEPTLPNYKFNILTVFIFSIAWFFIPFLHIVYRKLVLGRKEYLPDAAIMCFLLGPLGYIIYTAMRDIWG